MPVQPTDDATIRDVITRQLGAFARHDRTAAYAATAPNVRRKFPTPAAFDAMAEADYAPLFEVEREHFASSRGAMATATQGETWSQDVELATRGGERWLAVYGLERQPDGTIAVTSCVLIRRSPAAAARIPRLPPRTDVAAGQGDGHSGPIRTVL